MRGLPRYIVVDRTIPMLPERLSNGVCSLRPDEDKLCFSAIFKLDANAQVFGPMVRAYGDPFESPVYL